LKFEQIKKRRFEMIFFECLFSSVSYDQSEHNTYTIQKVFGSSTCVWSEGEISPCYWTRHQNLRTLTICGITEGAGKSQDTDCQIIIKAIWQPPSL